VGRFKVVLLVGPQVTANSLAKAVGGEQGVPLLLDFGFRVRLNVRRWSAPAAVRALFGEAKKNAPWHRRSSTKSMLSAPGAALVLGRRYDEREQNLNQTPNRDGLFREANKRSHSSSGYQTVPMCSTRPCMRPAVSTGQSGGRQADSGGRLQFLRSCPWQGPGQGCRSRSGATPHSWNHRR